MFLHTWNFPKQSSLATLCPLVPSCKACKKFVQMKQVHSAVVDIWEKGLSPQQDAIITAEKNLGLIISFADCQPIFLFSPQEQVFSAIHNGWRGAVQNIVGKTIASLQETFSIQPKNLRAYIGPSLCSDHSEFKDYQTLLPRAFQRFEKKPLHFDFWEITLWQLKNSGLLQENIHFLRQCTYCLSDRYHSYRRGDKVERNYALGWMR